ncbi:MAG TPA: RDD family protein [Thermoanaerobaculia bacterium]|nr:RDD family protein [Thermoanaerobaculia bacterium]
MKAGVTIDAPRIHRIRTPEGLSLPFTVAPVGDRLGAFLIDLLLIVLGSVLVWVLAVLATAVGAGELGLSFALLVSFFLWNFYFIACEVHWGGTTVGKRKLGLRVISRSGGPLTAEAIFARNLMRNLELYLPLPVLLAPESFFPGAPGWAGLLAGTWVLVFAFMPLFNRDRLRCGDMVAGTLVVRAPASVLLPDLATRPASVLPQHRAAAPAEAFTFTREQLDIYGIHELQVLEDLLRRDEQGTLDGGVLAEVCEKIKIKIGWPYDEWQVPVVPFLQAFYRAQRALLEQKMLFGQRREKKRA